MPELAEVEFYRKRWHQAACGQTVRRVHLHPQARVFRDEDPRRWEHQLEGATFSGSQAAAKQIVLRFDDRAWLGVHLGMSGELSVRPSPYPAGKHDHFMLEFPAATLVFTDPRMFGEIRFATGPGAPEWWERIPPALTSPAFTRAVLAAFLQRRGRAPIKAVLLMQERFPGIGNWMADEVLWRAGIAPTHPAGSLDASEVQRLWRELRQVCRQALGAIAGRGEELPPDLNVNIPNSWLFRQRWSAGGRCPRCGASLARKAVGGRTTCWCPVCQPLRRSRATARATGRARRRA